MKLITEISEDFEITEEIINEATNEKRLFIEGVFMQGGVKNRNGRIYPTDMLSEKVHQYNTSYVAGKRAYGELGHPSGPGINGDRICMRITELKQSGNDFLGKAQISSTPMGKIVEGLIKDGGQLGVSSRGMGSLVQKNGINEVQNDFVIAAVDVVTDPSAPNAFVDGIMEGVEFYYDSDRKTWMSEQIKNEVKKMSVKELEEQKLFLFKRFINNL